MVLEEAESRDFSTCRSAKTASTRIVDTAGANVPSTFGENVNPYSSK